MTQTKVPRGLGAAVLALGIAASGAMGQTPFQAEITSGRDGGTVSVTATLPEGWVASTHMHGVDLFLDGEDRRAISLAIGQWARERLGDRRGFGFGTVERGRVTLGGQPATSYRGPPSTYGTPVQIGLEVAFLSGAPVLVHFDGCHGERQDPMIMRIAGSGAPIGELDEDPYLSALFAGLTIEQAPGAAPCPPDLAAALGAVPAPVTRDGWTLRERFGLPFWLPEGFEIGYDGLNFFDAMHPDHDNPDRTGAFGFSLQQLFGRDEWRDETPPDAVLTVLPDRDFGPAGRFEVVSAAFQQQGYAIDGMIMIARESDRDQRYLMVTLVSVGQAGQVPWLGLQDLRDEILARLGRP